ncbi:MAG: FtsQ-type POTRA domain-containing protein [Proteobacteria bacterium]|nr:FtsQ-type POTRA domain-containing protein [Pseudomonadota bacterium]MBT7813191.1 FtsQ-type POTRA domain-containing protein [Pseudomonadota bacterium]MBT7965864.1 FtsQ-type POTRA domain-containing protein [Pseudomonadota bacterium]
MSGLGTKLPELRAVGGKVSKGETIERSEPRRRLPMVAGFFLFFMTVLVMDHVIRSGYFTIQKVVIDSPLLVISQGSIERETWRKISGNYLNVDLKTIETALENRPGVYQAVVRRVWPDTLSISVVETQVIAEYRQLDRSEEKVERQFINLPPQNGFSFRPLLRGPERYRAVVVDTFHEIFSLLAIVNLEPRSLSVGHSGQWELELRRSDLKLENTFRVFLGRDQIVEKIERLVFSFETVLSHKAGLISKVDMRYDNGFAVQWHDDPEDKKFQIASVIKDDN